MRPLPPTYPALKVHDLTPPLSPTTSVESSGFPVTPTYPRTASEGVFESRFGLLKNSSEVWEESKDADYDPSSVTIADPGILISPSSSLLSGLDLLGGTTAPPLPKVADTPIRSRSHRVTIPHKESPLDFPPPPTLVPNRRPSFKNSRPIIGRPSTVSPFSHPGLAASYECIPQSSHCSQSSTSQRRWSALPPTEFHPYSRRRSSDFVTTNGTSTAWSTGPADRPNIHLDISVAAPRVRSLPTSHASPGGGRYVEPAPPRQSRRKEKSDPFTSFIDMSTATDSALCKSRVHKLFSKISSGFKPRKRHY